MRSLISDDLQDGLAQAQQALYEKNVPVLMIFEGASGRVITRAVNELIRCLEPRGVHYHHFEPRREDGSAVTLGYLQATPAAGDIEIFDRSWYAGAIEAYRDRPGEMAALVERLAAFERYLLDAGTFIVKVFLRASAVDLEKYAEDYRPPTALTASFLAVDHVDRLKYRAVFPALEQGTNTDRAPWDLIKVGPVEDTVEDVAAVVLKRMGQALKNDKWKKPEDPPKAEKYPNPRKGLDLDGDTDHYSDRMEELSAELGRLQLLLSVSGRSMVIGFEGWDAAGKGSCIKHLTHALNPRGYRVRGTKAPTDTEKAHSYLWRFAADLPLPGHITIFDRTWYGRMMVEPIEELCTEDEYGRAAGEINTYEQMLASAGVIVIKFWLDISDEVQLERFNDRKDDPLKQWKLTDEDWRNREKRPVYEKYVNAMIEATNTPYAPWTVVPANAKKGAHLAVLTAVVDALHRELEPGQDHRH